MASIDDRIVQMTFDNAAFERKMAITIQSLEKLNSTLANAGSRNGMDRIAESARNFHLGPMSAAIDGISAKFLALSTIAITALSNIVNRAVDAGIQLAKAISLDPVIAGFREYELQIGSIQTILANTSREGTTLTDVNAALDELNEYSDKTIYNFAQMTRNIGTFTAAGVDLDTSVMSIKGIANLAAISGSTSEQASMAMYQLSQAIANNKVGLVDWNSVVNAGMGGEVFQRALFTTGQAMGTIVDAPIGMTFDEWTAAGNSFRTSLQDGWLTGEVLTTTLQGFTGEMTEAQLTAIGYTQEQAQEIMKLGEMGVDAATKVRTLTQMISTTKEALQSGWAQSFRLIFGDFEEATALWTEVSEAVGGFVSRSADARNAMLQDWKDLGGRTKLIEGVRDAFKSLGAIFRPIKEAFREIFPAMTGQRLFEITSRFAGLMKALYPGPATVENLKRIFTGLFSALEIGWEIIKNTAKFIGNLFKTITGAGSGNFLEFFADIGDFFTRLNQGMVGEGGIARFFENLGEGAKKAVGVLKDLLAPLGEFFSSFLGRGADAAGGILDTVREAFSGLGESLPDLKDGMSGLEKVWEPIKNMFSGVGDILENAWDGISDFFGQIGDKIGEIFGDTDFGRMLDVLQTGLLGGIVLLLRNFLRGGGPFGGISDLIGKVSGAFEQLTGVLGAMQANLRASALLKIAAAVGILAASLFILSSIEPERLSDSLAAMALGFGQLIGTFALLNKMAVGPAGAASMNLVATSLMLIAGAVIVLTAAIKLLSMMSWEEIGKGLAGVGGAMVVLAGGALALSRVKGGLVRIGLGLMGIAIALGIMALAVKAFSMMDWTEIGRGLAGVAGSLVAIAAGMQLMPRGLLLQGAGLLLVGAAINIIALALKQFASMTWDDIGRGLGAMAGALVSIGLAVNLMPPTLPVIGAGLIAVSFALGIIAGVMQTLGTMSWESIGKGLAAMAGALLIMSLALAGASHGALGAPAIFVMAYALRVLAEVLEQLGSMSWGNLLRGLAALSAILAVLGIAALVLSPVIPSLLGLGAALLLIGAGAALFGVGVMAIGKGLQVLADVGGKAIDVLLDAIHAFLEELPAFMKDVADSVLEFVQHILEGLPDLLTALGEAISAMLDVLKELIPKAGEVIRLLMEEILQTIREIYPQLIATGLEMLLAVMTGIRDNIGEIVTVAVQIATEFMDALAEQVPALIDSAYNLVVAVIQGVVSKLVDIGQLLAPKGLDLIQGLLSGAAAFATTVLLPWLQDLPGRIKGWVGDLLELLRTRGRALINGLWNGIWDFTFGTVVPWLKDLPNKIKNWIGDLLDLLKSRGMALINGLWNGIQQFWRGTVLPWLKDLPARMKRTIGDLIETLLGYGKNLVAGLYNGAIAMWNRVKGWFADFPKRFRTTVTSLLTTLKDIGGNLVGGLYNGAIAMWNRVKGWFSDFPERFKRTVTSLSTTLRSIGGNLIGGLYNGAIAMWNRVKGWFGGIGQGVRTAIGGLRSLLSDIGANIMNSLKNGAANVFETVKDWFVNKANAIKNAVLDFFGIGSPSKVFMWIGEMTMEGLKVGLEDEWDVVARWLSHINPADSMQKNLAERMNEVIAKMAEQLGSMDEFTPTITPVLDLSQVRFGASQLSSLLANSSYIQAAGISVATRTPVEIANQDDKTRSGDVNFVQLIQGSVNVCKSRTLS